MQTTKTNRILSIMLAIAMLFTSMGMNYALSDIKLKNKDNKNLYLNSPTQIKDKEFRKVICKNLNLGDRSSVDWSLTDEDLPFIENLQSLTIQSEDIVNDLSGIELFKGLKNLTALNNNIKNPDISQNLLLENVNLGENKIDNLDVSKNINLKTLKLDANNFSNIDLTNNTELLELNIDKNKIKNIDVSKNAKLQILSAEDNIIEKIDFGAVDGIKEIRLANNNLPFIDIGGNKPTVLSCDNQNVSGELYFEDNLYKFDIKKLVGNDNLSNVEIVSNDNGIIFDKATGIVSFISKPNSFSYNYNSKQKTNNYMQNIIVNLVALKTNFNVSYETPSQGTVNTASEIVANGKKPTQVKDAVPNQPADYRFIGWKERILIKDLILGEDRSAILTQGGKVYMTGGNVFTEVDLAAAGITTPIKQVSLARNQTGILTEDGKVYMTGRNDEGQLGLGDNAGRNVFTEVDLAAAGITTPIKQLSLGDANTGIITEDGKVYMTGKNTWGQLGLGDNTNRNVFTKVNLAAGITGPIKQVSLGRLHTGILTEDGNVYMTGFNLDGQLGLGNSGSGTHKNVFTKVNLAGAGITSPVKQLSLGYDHTAILTQDGKVYMTGNNTWGQLGLGNKTKTRVFTQQISAGITGPIKQLSSGADNTGIITESGKIYMTGRNDYGQLGLGDKTDRNRFTEVNLIAEGIRSPIKQLALEYYHTGILTQDDKVYMTGRNANGQLGLGNRDDKTVFTPSNFGLKDQLLSTNDIKNMVITEDKAFVAQYELIAKQYKITYDPTDKGTANPAEEFVIEGKKPTQVKDAVSNQPTDYRFTGWKEKVKVKDLMLGYHYSAILTQDNRVYMAGDNDYGQLGLGDYTDRNAFTEVNLAAAGITNQVKQLSVGDFGAGIITVSGKVYMTGRNTYGQLGLGDNTNRNVFTEVNLARAGITGQVKQLSLGYAHTGILTEDNKVYMAGMGDYMGLGDNTSRYVFTQVDLVRAGITSPVKQLVLNVDNSGILTEDGKIYMTGDNGSGQLGLEDNTNRNVFTKVDLVRAGITSPVKQLFLGNRHSAILTQDNRVYMTGNNGSGQLGLGDKTGRNAFTEVNLATAGITSQVKQLSLSDGYSGILTQDNKLYMTGNNNKGQLGLGDTNNRNAFTEVNLTGAGITSPLKQVSVGYYHSGILTQDDKVYMVGWNTLGQLGLRDNIDRNVFSLSDLEFEKPLLTTDAIKNMTITGDKTFVAQYEVLPKYKLTYDPTNKGTVTPANETVPDGNKPTLTTDAVPNQQDDYRFTGWKEKVKVKEIVNGTWTRGFVTTDGELYMTGYNDNGQLGLGDNANRTVFTKVSLPSGVKVKQLSIGAHFSIILAENGKVYGTGRGGEGSLGLGNDTANKNVFTEMPNLPTGVTIKQIVAGEALTIIVTTTGELYMTGTTGFGQTGDPNLFGQTMNSLTKIPLPNGIKVDKAYNNGRDWGGKTGIITTTGELYMAGYNIDGELGLGNNTNQNAFTKVNLPAGTVVKQLSIGSRSTMLLTEDNQIYTTGWNNFGQLGLGNTTSRNTFTKVTNLPTGKIKSITAYGKDTIYLLMEDGKVYGTGINNEGNLGLGTDTTNKSVFTNVPLPSGVKATQLVSGSYSCGILSQNNEIYVTGYNRYGQLGLGNTTDAKVMTKVGLPIFGLKDQLLTTDDIKNMTITEDKTFVAQYEVLPKHKLTYDPTNKGTVTATNEIVADGKKPTLITDAVPNQPADYRFTGWKEKVKVKDLILGEEHSAILTQDNKVYMAGRNNYGQLGLGDTTSRNVFTEVNLIGSGITSPIKQMSLATSTTGILTEDGKVYMTGRNDYGQLGLGDATNRNVFTEVSLATAGITSPVKQLSLGVYHTGILTEDGNVYITGLNDYGQLGLGNSGSATNKNVFTKVNLATAGITSPVKQLSLGGSWHSAILTQDGKVYMTGRNDVGQLGLGDTANRNVFTEVNLARAGITSPVKQLSLRVYITGILTQDGKVYMTGRNEVGQLGLGDNTNKNVFTEVYLARAGITSPVKQLSLGNRHSAILTQDNRVYMTGRNDYGQLGLLDTTNRNVFKEVEFVRAGITSPVKQLSIGGYHNGILTQDNNVYMTGSNNNGQLGLGNTTNISMFTKVDLPNFGLKDQLLSTDDIKNMAITGDKTFVAQYEMIIKYKVTYDPTDKGTVTPTEEIVFEGQKPTLTTDAVSNQPADYRFTGWKEKVKIKEVVGGMWSRGFVTADGEVYVTGWNTKGDLGLGDAAQRNTFTKVALPTGVKAKHLSMGYYHSIILAENGKVYVTGSNDDGQLGLGNNDSKTVFTEIPLLPNGITVKQIVAGENSTALITTTDELYMCGENDKGELGLGDTVQRDTFTKVTLPNGIKVDKVYSNGRLFGGRTGIITTTGEVYMTGYNIDGELGLGDTNQRNTFTKVNLPAGTVVKQLSFGMKSTALLTDDNQLYTTGDNNFGQLGLNDTNNRNFFTKVTNLPTDEIQSINAGGQNTLYLLMDDGKVYGTGKNENGELGLGTDLTNKSVFTNVPLPQGVKATRLSTADANLGILTQNNEIYATGWNGRGQLGLGNTTNATVMTKVTLPNFGLKDQLSTTDDIKNMAITEDKTFVAQYELIPKPYKVTYDPTNKGTVTPTEEFVVEGQKPTLTTDAVSNQPADYRFTGWKEKVKVKDLIVGNYHSAILTQNNKVYMTGRNSEGQLGLGNNTNKNVFTKVNLAAAGITSPVKQVSLGDTHTGILTEDGKVYMTGRNDYGGLGLGDNTNKNVFTEVNLTASGITSPVKQLSLGAYVTGILTEDSKVYMTGYNVDGQLGLGNNDNRTVFTAVNLAAAGITGPLKQLSLGGLFSGILTEDGKVYMTGDNEKGQLGSGNNTGRTVFTEVNLATAGITSPVKQLSLGIAYAGIITQDGKMYMTGYNGAGGLGLGDNNDRNVFTEVNLARAGITSPVKQLSLGNAHTGIITQDNRVYMTGINDLGQLGLGDNTNKNAFTEVNLAAAGITSPAKQLSVGRYFSAILTKDGKVYMTGRNVDGELGLGDNTNRNVFTEVNISNFGLKSQLLTTDDIKNMAITEDKTFVAQYELIPKPYKITYDPTDKGIVTPTEEFVGEGKNPTQITNAVPKQPDDYRFIGWKEKFEVKDLILADAHAGIITQDNKVYMTGDNDKGQLGLGDTTNRNVFTEVDLAAAGITSQVKQLSLGSWHSGILTQDGKVYMAGRNTYGQLGLGDNNDRHTFTEVNLAGLGITSPVKQLSLSSHSTGIITEDGEVYMTGYNGKGQLGLGDTTDRKVFTEVDLAAGIISPIKQLSLAGFFSGILTEDGKLYMAGHNVNGQLGLGDNNDRHTFTEVNLEGAGITSPVKQLVLKLYTAGIITQDNKVYMTGLNDFGQLGLGDTTNRNVFTAVDLATAGITSPAKQLSFGSKHGGILTQDGKVYMTGYNGKGQLSLGDNTDRNVFTEVDLAGITSTVKQLSLGGHYSGILTQDGKVYMTGYNHIGQLGLGDTSDRNVFTKVDLPDYVLKDQVLSTDDVKNMAITGDKTFVAQYEVIPKYKVTYDPTDKGTVTPTEEIVIDVNAPNQITDPVPKQPDDYRFIGWKEKIEIKEIVNGTWTRGFVRADGELYMTGENNHGQLGLGDTVNRTTFTKVSLPSGVKVKQLSIGAYFTIILAENGKVYGTGRGAEGQLGLGNTDDKTVFTEMINLPTGVTVKQIVAGEVSTALVTTTGELYMCGKNDFGQLGNPALGKGATTTLTKIPLPNGIKVDKAYGNGRNWGGKTGIITTTGEVYMTGANQDGELGLGDTNQRDTFTKVNLPAGTVVKQLSIGSKSTILLTEDNQIYTTGLNNYGQLGLGNTTNRNTFTKVTNLPTGKIKSITAYGRDTIYLLMEDGKVYGTGRNNRGQLGLGTDTTNKSVFTNVPLPSGVKATQLISGSSSCGILSQNNEIYVTGWNAYGQLGLGNTTDATVMTEVTLPDLELKNQLLSTDDIRNMVITKDTTFVAQYKLTPKHTVTYDPTDKGTVTPTSEIVIDGKKPTQITDAVPKQPDKYRFTGWKEKVKDLIMGGSHSAILTQDNKLYMTGRNFEGQLGLGNSGNGADRNVFTEVDLAGAGITSPVKQVSLGSWYTGILTEDGNVYMTGRNLEGQLGLGDNNNRKVFTKVDLAKLGIISPVKQLVLGSHNTGIITEDGKVYVVGNNKYGQLGLGDNTNRNVFTQVNLTGSPVKQMAMKEYTTGIITENGKVYTTGRNLYGQLGLEDYNNRNTLTEVNLTRAGITSPVKQLSLGFSHTGITTQNGKVYMSGRNNEGQLGLGDSNNRTTFTEVSLAGITSPIKQLSLGGGHSGILTQDGKIYMTGYNADGGLGLGDNNARNVFTEVNLARAGITSPVKQLSLGVRDSGIITEDIKVYLTGENTEGQLGLGDNTNRDVFTLSDFVNLSTNDIKNMVITKDTTFVAQYELIPEHKVTYDPTDKGTVTPTEEIVVTGGKPTKITDAVPNQPDDYRFTGWKEKIKFKDLILGGNHSAILTQDGKVYMTGGNSDGELGLGDTTNRTAFREVDLAAAGITSPVKQLSLGYDHSAILTQDGKVYMTGRNDGGQLGLRDKNSRTVFTEVGLVAAGITSPVKQLSLGYAHTGILTEAGKLYMTGKNNRGELGLGDNGNNTERTAFTEVDLTGAGITSPIKQLSSGGEYAGILTENGKVYMTGSNSLGELGLGDNNDRNVFTQAVGITTPIKQLSPGISHTGIITQDGKLYMTGYNHFGQLGLKDKTDRNVFTEVDLATAGITSPVKQLSLGSTSTGILTEDGNVYMTGRNEFGQLGLKDKIDRNVFTEVDLTGAGITSPIKQLSSGNSHTGIITQDGKLYMTGYNFFGQLGLGINIHRYVFTKINTDFVLKNQLLSTDDIKNMAITEDKIFVAQYKLTPKHKVTYDPTDKGTVTPASEVVIDGKKPTKITDAVPKQPDDYRFTGWKEKIKVKVKDLSSGYDHSAILTQGKVFVVGRNAYGQLGLGDNSDRNVFTEVNLAAAGITSPVKQLVLGGYSTGILTEDGKLYIAGRNRFGQLGLRDNTDRNVFTEVDLAGAGITKPIKQLVLGGSHTGILTQDNEVYMTGLNMFGTLGLGDNRNKSVFTKVDLAGAGITSPVKQLSLGDAHTGILTEAGRVYTTGENGFGQLGSGFNIAQYTFQEVQFAGLGTPSIKQLILGGWHTAVLAEDGKVYMTGDNIGGQLGLGDVDNRNAFTEVNLPAGITSPIKQVTAGYKNTGILTDVGKMYVTGDNAYGQLGLGDDTNKNVFTEANLAAGITNPIKQAFGAYFAGILTEDGKVYVTGRNNYGQLGLGDIDNTPNINVFTEVSVFKPQLLSTDDIKNMAITENTTFVAQYKITPKYKVTYDPTDKGTVTTASEIVIDGKNPTKITDAVPNQPNDYRFTGWKEKVEVKDLILGYFHSAILTQDNKVYMTGDNIGGQLGLGDNTERKVFTEVNLAAAGITSPIKQLSLGGGHSGILTQDGKVYMTGHNRSGQLGLGDSGLNAYKNVFTEVDLAAAGITSPVKQLSLGGSHTGIITQDNKVYMTGYNGNGGLGLGNSGPSNERKIFTEVDLAGAGITSPVKQLSLGQSYSGILTQDGKVYMTGVNVYGELGLGDNGGNTGREVFTEVNLTAAGITSPVKQLSLADGHTGILTENGKVYMTGRNDHGELGLGDTAPNFKNVFTEVDLAGAGITSPVKQLSLGESHTGIITQDNKVYMTGNNLNGELGLGNNGTGTERKVFTEVNLTGAGITSPVKQLSLGSWHTGILTEDSNVYMTGNNTVGQFGSGNKIAANVMTNINLDLGLKNLLSTEQVKQQAITFDTTFVAQYEIIPKYKVTYDPTDNGTVNPTEEIVIEGKNPTLTTDAVPKKPDDYRFSGWKEKVEVKDLILGNFHSAILTQDGKVYMTGSNDKGQLGLGNSGAGTNKNVFTEVDLAAAGITSPVKQVSLGGWYTGILTEDGKVYMTGYNGNGELGLGDNTDRKVFTEVDLTAAGITSPAKQLSLGESHTGIITQDNKVYMTGRNDVGQLGLGDTTNRKVFTEVNLAGATSPVKQMSLGSYHSAILTQDGKVYMTGYNSRGQLGLGDNIDRNVFTQVKITSLVKQLSLGAWHTGILTETGKVYMTGLNVNGQLGLGDNANKDVFTQVKITGRVKQLSLGGYNSGILTQDGKVYMTGKNQYGELGLVNNTDRNVFTELNLAGVGASPAKQLSLGESHTGIITQNGKVYMTGRNNNGQLGLRNTTDSNVMTNTNIDLGVKNQLLSTEQVKQQVITFDTTFIAQMAPKYKVTYDPTDKGTVTPTSEIVIDGNKPTQITDAVPNQPDDYRFIGWKEKFEVKDLSSGYDHSAILTQGKVFVVGRNAKGQLGLKDNTDRNVFTEVDLAGAGITSPVKQLVLGGYSTGILTEDDKLYMTGSNDRGRLGLGDETDRNTFTEVDLAAAGITTPIKQLVLGGTHTGILTQDNKLYMTGDNQYGGLGLGNSGWGADRNVFTKVDLAAVGITTPIKQLSLGDRMTGILTEDGKAYMTGNNWFGQFGISTGDVGNKRYSPVFVKIAAEITTPIKQLSLGAEHTAVLTDDGKMYVTGQNASGQLGLTNAISDARVWKFTEVDLAFAGITTPIKQVFGGYRNTGILTEDGKIYGTGSNDHGQLGLGNYNDINTFKQVNLTAAGITSPIKLVFGAYFTGILTEDGKIYVTGRNNYGQLGLGDGTSRNVFTEVSLLKPQLLSTDDIKNMAITESKTFVAQYVDLYSVKFENGNVPADQIVGNLPDNHMRLVNGTVITLTPPTNYERPDYNLIGWTTDRNNQLVVTVPLDGQITINGANIVLYPVFEKDTSTSINISMPLRLAFGNYSDKATSTADYAISQAENRFHSSIYSITNNSTFVGIGDGSVKVSIAGMEQTGNNKIELVPEISSLNANTSYNSNQMRVGLTLDGVGSPFVSTNISPDIQAKGDVAHGLTKERTVMFSSMLNSKITNKTLELGILPSARLNLTETLIPKVGQFKIVGDASNQFPKDNIQQDYKITFKFARMPD